MNLLEKILEYIFLPSCGVCKKLGEGYLCNKCGKDIEKYKIELIESEKINGIQVEKIYLFKYLGIIRRKIIEYKFNDKPYLYKMFCKTIIENKKTCEFIKSYDIIIPVPIYKKRKKSRGYNQSELISREIAKKLNLQMFNNVLIKISNNEMQSKLNRKQRLKNVKNVYKIINKEKITNKDVIIFDDIYTTGSTINECISILKKANVNKIGVLILAKD